MEAIMKIFISKYIGIFAMILASLLLVGPFMSIAQEDTTGMTLEHDFLLVEGKVSSVSIESNELTVKPNKGKKVMVLVDSETIFLGEAASLLDIEKRQKVKVWYLTEGERNRAIKVEKIPKLGC
jgi:hypothetical protein